MNITPALKKVWNIASTAIVAVVVLIAVFLMGSRLMGFEVYNVVSGSMAPKYNVGDLLYVKSVSPSEIKVGDAITFVRDAKLTVATHEVVRIDNENLHFYTKGLANENADQNPVHFENLIGVPVFKIPLLGYVSDFIQHPPGLYITIAAGVILIAVVILPDVLVAVRKKKEGISETVDDNPENDEPITVSEENADFEENKE